MESLDLIKTSSQTRLQLLSKESLIENCLILQDELARVVRENYRLRSEFISDLQLSLIIDEQLKDLKNKIFGSSSEKYNNPNPKKDSEEKPEKTKKPQIKKPSERYPNLPVREIVVSQEPPPSDDHGSMRPTGMYEITEQLTVIPKKYEILRYKHVIYGSQGKDSDYIQTTPAPDRIKAGSTYSDEMILDVSLSKYLDLIPIQRQAAMARRTALIDIPPQSLIECTHYLAEFIEEAYLGLKTEVLQSKFLHADETPHKMLEGDEKKSWYLWGFSTSKVCFFECHRTRSGDVASEILLKSCCEFLLTDAYSGYGKAVGLVNEERLKNGLPMIKNAYCNAHSRRYFVKSYDDGKGEPEAEFYLIQYQKIYALCETSYVKALPEILELRAQMKPYFESMRVKAAENIHKYSSKSQFGKAMNYFLENYQELTLFLTHAEVPIDNNPQERLLRPHVVGRKTWYGTHSQRGAKTAAIMFSLVETCKLNGVNAREYFKILAAEMLGGYPAFTPAEYKARLASPNN